MTWIKTVTPAEAEPALRALYRKLYSSFPSDYLAEVPALVRSDGTADSITSAHSLLPEVMEPIFIAMARLLAPELPLTRRQHEMIATLVSSLNGCFY